VAYLYVFGARAEAMKQQLELASQSAPVTFVLPTGQVSCCDSRARHLHNVVCGGSWRAPETHAFCFSHVARAQAHVAVVSKDPYYKGRQHSPTKMGKSPT